MGHNASAGVIFRMGLPLIAGERVASSLTLTLGSFDCVIDNVSCFNGETFPSDGSVMHFGEHRIYVPTITKDFPREAIIVSGAPPGFSAPCIASSSAEVMMVGSGNDHRSPLERNVGGNSTTPHEQDPDPLVVSIQNLRIPIVPEVDPAATAAALEATLQNLLEEASKVAARQRHLDTTMCE